MGNCDFETDGKRFILPSEDFIDKFEYKEARYYHYETALLDVSNFHAFSYLYFEYSDEVYFEAKDFMLKPLNEGGTTSYKDGGVYFYEVTTSPIVLNGWIFSAWGLFDYACYFKDKEIEYVWNKTIETMIQMLPEFDNGYWSLYKCRSSIASPFYHRLHIAQLKVLYDMTGEKKFLEYATKFENYQKSWINRKRAFVLKAIQKIF